MFLNTFAAQPVVFDFSIFGNAAYLEAGPQNAKTKKLCYELAKTIISEVGSPDLVVYLDCPVDDLEKRIAARGRDIEKDIPKAYLR